jgi:glycosyltransferase involved in cell wall biosynthesis
MESMAQLESLYTIKRKINILYISNQGDFSGGAQKSLCDIISHLDRKKYNPYFVSIHDSEVTGFIKDILGVPCIKINEFKRRNPFPHIISQLLLIYHILRNRIDLIHNNQLSDTFYTWLPAFITKTKMIIHHRDSNVLSGMDRFLINRADCNICVSSWQNNTFLNKKAVIIHNGIDLNKIHQQIDTDQVKTNNDIKKPITVGLVGRIAPIKGQNILIEAANIVLEKFPNAKFLLYGKIAPGVYIDYYHGLVDKIKELGLGEQVLFQGYRDEIGDIYPQLDISVVPSLREPCARVIIESMAFSKPVIATGVGGSKDLVTQQSGILVPVNDPNALAEAILLLANNPSMRFKMGKTGRERVESNFTIERTLTKINAVYETLL